MNKIFDLRTVIGIFFLIIGLLLFAYSFSSVALQRGNDINRWCGIIFSIFGIGMLLSIFLAGEED